MNRLAFKESHFCFKKSGNAIKVISPQVIIATKLEEQEDLLKKYQTSLKLKAMFGTFLV